MNIPESEAWGTILAGITRYLADALELMYGTEKSVSIRQITENFLAEIASSSSDAEGGFA